MPLQPMYPATVNSVPTATTADLTPTETEINVLDGGVLPEPPNLLTLGNNSSAETVLMTAREGNTLTVERGVQGAPRTWPEGTQIARNFTAYDHDATVANLQALNAEKETPAGAQTKADAAKAAAVTEAVETAAEDATEKAAQAKEEAVAAAAVDATAKANAVREDCVPTSRQINGRPLTGDLNLSAEELGAAPLSQPKFREVEETTVEWEDIPLPPPILGAGWSGSGPVYTHAVGSDANLSFPIHTQWRKVYEIKYIQTTGNGNNSTIKLSTVPDDLSGYTKPRKFTGTLEDTMILVPVDDYSWINLNPDPDWAGSFQLISVRMASSFNSSTLSIKDVEYRLNNASTFQGDSGTINAGADNLALGQWALRYNTVGKENLALGKNTLSNNTIGNYNVGVGLNCLVSNSIGACNTALGYDASRSIVGRNNVAIGYQAGSLPTGRYSAEEANNSLYLGAQTRKGSVSHVENEIVLGYDTDGNGSNTITLGNSDITRLYCKATSITAPSDKRLKEEIAPANLQQCYQDVKRLPIWRYKYKDFMGPYTDSHVTGFIADDVEEVFPKAVSRQDRYFPVLDEHGEPIYEEVPVESFDPDAGEQAQSRLVPKQFLLEDVKDITMTEALPTLWGAVQQLMLQVEELQAKLAE